MTYAYYESITLVYVVNIMVNAILQDIETDLKLLVPKSPVPTHSAPPPPDHHQTSFFNIRWHWKTAIMAKCHQQYHYDFVM